MTDINHPSPNRDSISPPKVGHGSVVDRPVAGRTEGFGQRPNVVEGNANLPAFLSVAGNPGGYKTMVAGYVLSELLPEWEKLFERKNAGYGEYDKTLGVKAEFVEIHRKYGKLKRAFWDEVPTDDWDEQPREVLMDLIGHCFLAIWLLDEEGHGDRKPPTG